MRWYGGVAIQRDAALLYAALLMGPMALDAQAPFAFTKLADLSPAAQEEVAALTHIRDLVAGRDGRAFILADPEHRIAVLRRRGRLLDYEPVALAKPLQYPVALTLDGHGQLYVLDAAAKVVVRFDVTGSGLQPAGQFSVPTGGSDMCAMNGMLYVYSPQGKQILSSYTRLGRRAAAFGAPFGGDGELKRLAMSHAEIVCLPQDSTIIVATELTGEARAYTAGGRLIWQRSIADLRKVAFLGDGRRSLTMSMLPGGADQLISIALVRPGTVALQYGFQATPHPQRDRFDRIDTRYLSSGTGTELGRQHDAPPGMSRAEGDIFFSVRQYRHPDITLWRRTGAPK